MTAFISHVDGHVSPSVKLVFKFVTPVGHSTSDYFSTLLAISSAPPFDMYRLSYTLFQLFMHSTAIVY